MARLITRDGLPTLDDILAPGLDVLFCGYNPATYAVGKQHYYARTANRFWEDLCEAGFTPRPLRGLDEDLLLPAWGLGLTDLVKRASPNIDDLRGDDYRAGAARLDDLLAHYRPRILCFNGLGLLPHYQRWGQPPVGLVVACVPSTSPRNQRLRVERLAAFKALKAQVDAVAPARLPGEGVRPARPHEAAALSALARASKAGWGYDEAFLEACVEALTVTSAAIAAGGVWVLATGDRLLGFYGLAPCADPGLAAGARPARATPALAAGAAGRDLTWLFVAPEAQGRGIGRRLLAHAEAVARAEGAHALLIESDPHAEAFYLQAGAVRIGEASSPAAPGRKLPWLRLDVERPPDKGPAVP